MGNSSITTIKILCNDHIIRLLKKMETCLKLHGAEVLGHFPFDESAFERSLLQSLPLEQTKWKEAVKSGKEILAMTGLRRRLFKGNEHDNRNEEADLTEGEVTGLLARRQKD